MASVTRKRQKAHPGTYFAPGERRPIFEDPLTQLKKEDECVLVKCVRPYTEFHYPGLTVEEWEVRFDDEPERTYVRVVSVRTINV